MGDKWWSPENCNKCGGSLTCQRWGGDDGGDIRISCESCGDHFVINRKDEKNRHFYVQPR